MTSKAPSRLAFDSLTERDLDSVALTDPEGDWTYRQLVDAATTEVGKLTDLPGGSALGLVASPDRRTIALLLGCIEARRTVLLLHPRLPDEARDRLAIRSGCGAVRTQTGLTALPGTRDPTALQGDEAVLVPTSGSTGEPKVVVLTLPNLNAAVQASLERVVLTPNSAWALSLPFSHVGGLSILSRSFAARARVVIAEFDLTSADVWERVEDLGITHLSLVPTQLDRATRRPFRVPACLSCVLVGGAPTSPELHRRALRAGLPVRLTYGMTEMASQITTQEDADVAPAAMRSDSGRPLAGVDVRLTADDRIEVRGPQLAPRYLHSSCPLADIDGYFTTNDCGRIEDGRLVVLGRVDEMVISGGENVFPREVEAQLELLDSIEEACVVGLPDPEWGRRLCALVAIRGLPEPAKWKAQLRAQLPPFAIPKEFFVVPELRRLPSLKCDRVWATRVAARMHAEGTAIDPSA